MTAISLFGETRIHVPKGSRVTEGGFSLFGDQEVNVTGGAEGATEIRIQTSACSRT